jgi:hypothetical protein
MPLDAHGDEADAGPGVEPAMEELQLGLARREPQEAEGGAELGETLVDAARPYRPEASPVLGGATASPAAIARVPMLSI